jgi:hypothetical protein
LRAVRRRANRKRRTRPIAGLERGLLRGEDVAGHACDFGPARRAGNSTKSLKPNKNYLSPRYRLLISRSACGKAGCSIFAFEPVRFAHPKNEMETAA